MIEFPSIDELTLKYKDILENEATSNVSGWSEPNFDDKCNEPEYLERALNLGPSMLDQFIDITEDLKKLVKHDAKRNNSEY